MTRRIAYLGPVGAIAEVALRAQADLKADELLPCQSIRAAVEAVEDDDADVAFVPYGGPAAQMRYATPEQLAYDTNLLIRREVLHPLELHLLAPGHVELAEVETLAAPTHLWAACRQAITRWLPTARQVAALSTVDAAERVAQGQAQTALGSRLVAERAGLVVVREDLLEAPEGQSDIRYVLLGRGVPPRSGSDRTSIVCFTERDQPGSLGHILQEFSVRGLNLTRVASQTSRSHLGDYAFFIDIEGHIADPLVLEALRGLRFRLREVKFLGSYPAAHAAPSRLERRVAAARAEAERWVDYLTAMIDR